MTRSEKATGTIAKSAAVVSIAVMFSRVLGLIREQIFAALFGAGFAYDSFVVAFRIPNLLRDLFGEGALSAAFVSVFSDYDSNRSRTDTWLLASNVLCFFTIALSVISLAGMFFSEHIVDLLAPDFSFVQGKSELTANMTVIMMPFLLFVSLSAVVMGILNTKGKFFIPALASSFFNLGSIVGGTLLAFTLPRYGHPAIIGMAFGTLIGGLLQLLVQLPSLKSTGFKFTPFINMRDPGLIRIVKLMLPAVIGLSATQITIFINTNFASSCMEGSVSWLNYAFRLVQLPIGLFGVAISIAALPVLAKYAAKKDFENVRDTFASSLTMVFCLTIPATFGLMILAEPIIRVIFEHGAFTAADTHATALALSLYAVGLFAYSANKVIVPVFYAVNATRYPVIGSFAAIAVNILIISSTIELFQHKAIALSTSATMILNFLFLAAVLYYKIGGYSLHYLFLGFAKILAAAIVMAVILLLSCSFLGDMSTFSTVVQCGLLAVLVTGGAFVYVCTLNFMKLPELTMLIGKVQTKLFRKD